MAAMERRRLVIIGNGMASARLCADLVARGSAERLDVTVLGAEAVAAYNRVLLSALLAGEATRDDIGLMDAAWYARNGITLRLGCRVTAVDRTARTVTLAGGESLPFDDLVFATGSEPLRPPVPGIDGPRVMAFRDLCDVEAMAEFGQQHVAVIGGGLLGIEAAYGLARAGHRVTLVHLMDRLMERQLDARAARHLARAVARRGIAVLLARQTIAIEDDAEAAVLRFADGSVLPADKVVVAAGIRPNVALARAAGIAVERGIVVDDGLAAEDCIFAIGECAQHRGIVYGLVEPAYAQARVLAERLTGGSARYEGNTLATNLKVSGIGVFSVGAIEAEEGQEVATLEDHGRGHYRKLVFQGGRCIGAVLVGDTADALWYRDLVAGGADIAAIRSLMIFGREVCQPPLAEAA